MKKLFCILMVLFFTLFTTSMAFGASNTSVMINNTYVNFNTNTGVPFIDSSNRTQVPLRATMEAYGCTVEWDSSINSSIVRKGNNIVVVPIGVPYFFVNNTQIPNDTIAVIKDGRIYLPIRAVLESIGAYVDWRGAPGAYIVWVSSNGSGDNEVTQSTQIQTEPSNNTRYQEYENLIESAERKIDSLNSKYNIAISNSKDQMSEYQALQYDEWIQYVQRRNNVGGTTVTATYFQNNISKYAARIEELNNIITALEEELANNVGHYRDLIDEYEAAQSAL